MRILAADDDYTRRYLTIRVGGALRHERRQEVLGEAFVKRGVSAYIAPARALESPPRRGRLARPGGRSEALQRAQMP